MNYLNRILLFLVLILLNLNSNAQLYVGAGPNILNSPGGDFDKSLLRYSFGYNGNLGFAFKGKYYVGLSHQNISFFVDEDKWMAKNFNTYEKVSGNFDYGCSNSALDFGYLLAITSKHHVLGIIGFGFLQVKRSGYSLENGFYRINSGQANLEGIAGRFNVSYLYNINRNFGVSTGISYQMGRANGNVLFNGRKQGMENDISVFTIQIGLFLSLFNKYY